jgi:hypothetical protein
MARDDAWIGGVGGDGELESVDKGEEGAEDGTEERGDDGVSESMIIIEVGTVKVSGVGINVWKRRGLKGGW